MSGNDTGTMALQLPHALATDQQLLFALLQHIALMKAFWDANNTRLDLLAARLNALDGLVEP